MKKVLLQFSVLCLLMPLLAPTCRSKDFDVAGVKIQLELTAESVNANPTKKDEVFSKTYTINMKSEFENRTQITASKLTDLYILNLEVKFNQANCSKLKSYSVKIDLPGAGSESKSSSTPIDCSSTTLVKYSAGSTNTFVQKVLTTNFADAIKKGDPILITFSMEAKDDIPSGFGASIFFASTAIYDPTLK